MWNIGNGILDKGAAWSRLWRLIKGNSITITCPKS